MRNYMKAMTVNKRSGDAQEFTLPDIEATMSEVMPTERTEKLY